MCEILNNGTVAAFFGAFFAFLLVSVTDYRRRLRTKRLITHLVSDNIDLARLKSETIKTNLAMVKEDGNATGAEVMHFSVQSIRDCQFQVLDMLNSNQKQGLEALIYWMEAIDRLIDEAMSKARQLIEMDILAPQDQRMPVLNGYTSSLEECEKNLNHFIEMAGHYVSGNPHKILEFHHPVG